MKNATIKSFAFVVVLGFTFINLGQSCKAAVSCYATSIQSKENYKCHALTAGTSLEKCKKLLKGGLEKYGNKFAGWCESHAACLKAEENNKACPSE